MFAVGYGSGGRGSNAAYWVVIALVVLAVLIAAAWIVARYRAHRHSP